MYIEVTHTTGQVSRLPVDTSTVIQIGPQGAPTAAFSMEDVEGVELVHADLPVEPDGEFPVVADQAAQPLSVASDPATPPVDPALAGPEATPAADPATVPDDPTQAPADPPVADSGTDSNPPSPETTLPTVALSPDPAHADAVTEATSALEVAAEVPEAAAQIATEALADVEQALTSWPDSAALLDAKAKLTELAATEAS